MEKLLSVLREVFVGKKFIYRSKYGGRPQGICINIQISNKFILDDDSTNILQLLSKGITSEVTDRKHTPIIAHQPHIQIISENGNVYDFEDCYFLDTNITLW